MNNIKQLLEIEEQRQREGLEMIPSENFVSPAVLDALGSVATNKYAEGYPGSRYYGGCEVVDEIEKLAIKRAKKLFDAEHVNVQPLSGAPANLAAYSAICEPGDTILGMDLSHGGHLTHGHPVTFTSSVYNFVRYKTGADGKIDLDELRDLALEHKPKILLVGFSSYTRNVDWKAIKSIADDAGAVAMADIAHIAGLIAGEVIDNPVPIFDIVTTTTHKTLRGPRGGMIMCKKSLAKAVDKAVFPGLQGGPHMNQIAALAVALEEASKSSFKKYSKRVVSNAKALSKHLEKQGFELCFGGTENHMLLIDMSSKGLSGQEAETALAKAGITVNKNVIPDDTRKPMDPSGIRLGTPALTARGMKKKHMKKIAEWIGKAIENHDRPKKLESIRKDVRKFALKFDLHKP